jgi:hypothetical protein
VPPLRIADPDGSACVGESGTEMQENAIAATDPKPFRWTHQKDQAAHLLALDEQTDEQIGAAAGVNAATLWRWKQHPDFAAKVQGIVATLGERSTRYAIAKRNRRIAQLDACWRRLKRIIKERAADESMKAVAGGKTGLLVRVVKVFGSGKNARVVENYKVDVRLLREFRMVLKQAAQELGQWRSR